MTLPVFISPESIHRPPGRPACVRFGGAGGGQKGREGAAGPDAPKRLDQLNILVVEDELLVAWHLEGLVRDMGASVCGIANDGESALAMARREQPDLILMDVNLGRGKDGVTVAAELTGDLDAYFLFVTAYDAGTVESRKRLMGVEGPVIGKPVDGARLGAAIRGVIQN